MKQQWTCTCFVLLLSSPAGHIDQCDFDAINYSTINSNDSNARIFTNEWIKNHSFFSVLLTKYCSCSSCSGHHLGLCDIFLVFFLDERHIDGYKMAYLCRVKCMWEKTHQYECTIAVTIGIEWEPKTTSRWIYLSHLTKIEWICFSWLAFSKEPIWAACDEATDIRLKIIKKAVFKRLCLKSDLFSSVWVDVSCFLHRKETFFTFK